MEAFLPVVALAALVWKFVDFLKYCTSWSSGGRNGAVTQLIIWVAGVVAVLLFARSDWAGSVSIGELTLDRMNLWSQIVAGLSVGSLTSVGFDTKKAVDATDSAKTPSLLPVREETYADPDNFPDGDVPEGV